MPHNAKTLAHEVEGYRNLHIGIGLFDLRFLVSHMLSDDRVELLDFHLVGHRSLIFCSRIVVPGACRRDQLNLISHSIYS